MTTRDGSDGSKRCARCKATKSVTEFRITSASKPDRPVYGWCLECSRSYQRDLQRKRRNDPELKRKQFIWRLRREYDISITEFDELLISQSGRCAICEGQLVDLSVDHDHDTGAVRGLLCRKHNTALGLLGDSPDLLVSALIYLIQSRVETHNGC